MDWDDFGEAFLGALVALIVFWFVVLPVSVRLMNGRSRRPWGR